ncbi:hypothetical protein J6590_063513 [Homalodisca vitripennis]|nr:hypothetical protein J6590_063513 [Homalodisca vitripennis]
MNESSDNMRSTEVTRQSVSEWSFYIVVLTSMWDLNVNNYYDKCGVRMNESSDDMRSISEWSCCHKLLKPHKYYSTDINMNESSDDMRSTEVTRQSVSEWSCLLTSMWGLYYLTVNNYYDTCGVWMNESSDDMRSTEVTRQSMNESSDNMRSTEVTRQSVKLPESRVPLTCDVCDTVNPLPDLRMNESSDNVRLTEMIRQSVSE